MHRRKDPGSEVDERKASSRSLARLIDEAQVTGQLDHPGVVPVHDLGLDPDGRFYFTMRLVRGMTLGEVFGLAAAEEEGWNLTRALGAVLKVCETMAFAHSRGVVHRDLKPSNIMVGRFGELYVMDWGLARVMQEEPEDGTAASHGEPSSAVWTERGGSPGVAPAHDGGRRRRDARVHVARASERRPRAGRSGLGHLFGGSDPLPAPVRTDALPVPGQLLAPRALEAGGGRSPGARGEARPRGSRRARGHHRSRDGEEARRALLRHGGPGQRSARVPGRAGRRRLPHGARRRVQEVGPAQPRVRDRRRGAGPRRGRRLLGLRVERSPKDRGDPALRRARPGGRAPGSRRRARTDPPGLGAGDRGLDRGGGSADGTPGRAGAGGVPAGCPGAASRPGRARGRSARPLSCTTNTSASGTTSTRSPRPWSSSRARPTRARLGQTWRRSSATSRPTAPVSRPSAATSKPATGSRSRTRTTLEYTANSRQRRVRSPS